jgi:formimidoylglutamate deiminase
MGSHMHSEIKPEAEQMTKVLHVAKGLLPGGWADNVRLTFASGVFGAIETGAPVQTGDEHHAIAVPGMANVHSHAFQRAMAGLAERRGPGDDSFWSWRETMYRFALAITPEQMEAVAAQAYVEMLEAGFTRVGEFHYLHHAPDGSPYADVAEMSARIAAAAGQAQIGLTLLPVLYAHSGFGGAAPAAAQRRFVCDLDRFATLVQGAERAIKTLEGASLALAPHSLRAVTPDELKQLEVLAGARQIHIHAAEQVAEVQACLAWSGARPIEWLLDHASLGPRWCLVHATHMTPEETRRLAATGAVAGLCPITEANLGDGIFGATEFLGAGGRFGIGTDSNVRIGLAEEFCTLEYGQRLMRRSRNVLAAPGASTGAALFAGALNGGAAALGRATAGFAIGADADIVTLRADLPAPDPDAQLDRWIFARGVAVDCVYARGRKVVRDGSHIAGEPIRARFVAAMNALARR